MFAIEDLVPGTSFGAQLDENVGPVMVLNIFTFPAGKSDAFVETWTAAAETMKKQPGFISAQLRRAVGNDEAVVNLAVWESTEALKNAVQSDDALKAHEWELEGVVARPLLLESTGPMIAP